MSQNDPQHDRAQVEPDRQSSDGFKYEINQNTTIDLDELRNVSHLLCREPLKELILAPPEQVVRDIRNLKLRKPGVFSPAEREYMRELIVEGKELPEIQHEFLFHTPEEVSEKFTIIRSASRRRKNFKNPLDALVYEAQWFSDLPDKRRSRRGAAVKEQMDEMVKTAQTLQKAEPKVLTEEEIQLRKQQQLIREQKRLQKLEQAKALKEEQRLWRLQNPNPRPRKNTKPRMGFIERMAEEASYFQSVTGDGKLIKLGDKRQRKQSTHFVPEFQDRAEIKRIQKRLLKVSVKRGPKKRKTQVLDSVDPNESFEATVSKVTEDLSDDDLEEVSPFDPLDIVHDSYCPLNGRKLFVDGIYLDQVPAIEFTTEQSSENLAIVQSPKVPLCNTLAYDIITSHVKMFRNLPPSFPPFTTSHNDEIVVNPLNKVKIRFLLYPEYTELFALSQPKRDELDCVFEMQKIFQIHYALYFSRSEKLKTVIYEDFCKGLNTAVENDNFLAFMGIIDTWNDLMVKLCPRNVKDVFGDINADLRCYLKEPSTRLDLLQTFISEVVTPTAKVLTPKLVSPAPYVKLKIDDILSAPTPPAEDEKMSDGSQTSSVFTVAKSEDSEDLFNPSDHYRTSFFRNLRSITEVSRFCFQQLLLIPYTRIVSPDSRGLRSYKAFTAEVYGELLPSFISEVLSKVNLQPHQSFYDLGSGVGNTTLHAALEFGVKSSGGCELMDHASQLTQKQHTYLDKQMKVFGLRELPLKFALLQSFVDNPPVREQVINCDVLIINNYLFDFELNYEVGKMLHGLKPGTKIISLRNFIPPRYKVGTEKTVFDYLKVEKHEMSDFLSVSWTANKVPYYISTVQESICPEYL